MIYTHNEFEKELNDTGVRSLSGSFLGCTVATIEKEYSTPKFKIVCTMEDRIREEQLQEFLTELGKRSDKILKLGKGKILEINIESLPSL